jgi:hypothetical protein
MKILVRRLRRFHIFWVQAIVKSFCESAIPGECPRAAKLAALPHYVPGSAKTLFHYSELGNRGGKIMANS